MLIEFMMSLCLVSNLISVEEIWPSPKLCLNQIWSLRIYLYQCLSSFKFIYHLSWSDLSIGSSSSLPNFYCISLFDLNFLSSRALSPLTSLRLLKFLSASNTKSLSASELLEPFKLIESLFQVWPLSVFIYVKNALSL